MTSELSTPAPLVIRDIIALLEKATNEDGRLDADIFACVFGVGTSVWANFNGRFTGSVDDALALMPEDTVNYLLATHNNPPSFLAEVQVRIKKKKNYDKETFQAFAPTAALAMSIAALKAREATSTAERSPEIK